MTALYIDGRRIKLDPQQALGKGGEADVYTWGTDEALKVYKAPDHPDYALTPFDQQAAEWRLQQIGQKLHDFPRMLPERVIAPRKLATDVTGKQVLGYTMRLLKPADELMHFSGRSFREQHGITPENVVAVLQDLRATVQALHRAGVVIGDFNDLNVLVKDQQAWMIDADSFQFGRYECPMFTTRFVDPVLCPGTVLDPAHAHNEDSDWYAFAVMLFLALLNTHPYGGVYKPKNPLNRIAHEQRPLKRITVFNPEVVYPKPAWPYRILPDETLQYFHRVFEKDERGECPPNVMEILNWKTCAKCGQVYARPNCPDCAQPVPLAAVRTVVRAKGSITQQRLLRTSGVIAHVTVQNGKPLWLHHEGGRYLREDGQVVCTGPYDPRMRVRLQGPATILGQRGQALLFEAGKVPQRMAMDSGNAERVFVTNAKHRYWIHQGQLQRDSSMGSEFMGDVLQGQTHLFMGPAFGWGYYHAGQLSMVFVFDAERRGLNDRVKFTGLDGHWTEVRSTFSDQYAWIFVQVQRQRKLLNCCLVLDAFGKVQAQTEAVQGDGSWLGALGGKAAMGPYCFSVTDDGLTRLKVEQGAIIPDKTYPDTEPFVREGLELFAATDGLVTATAREIHLLKLA